jgi:hypothetical protein
LGVQSKGWNGASNWWRDFCSFYDFEGQGNSNLLFQNFQKMVEDGKDSLFWLDNWVTDRPLKSSFKRLFSLVVNKEASIFEMGDWREWEWRWSFYWRRPLFTWEEELVNKVLVEIGHFCLEVDKKDYWRWKSKSDGIYLAKLDRDNRFSKIWNNYVPSKVTSFYLATFTIMTSKKKNLVRRGVNSNSDSLCIGCNAVKVSENHLFFECPFFSQIWYCIAL